MTSAFAVVAFSIATTDGRCCRECGAVGCRRTKKNYCSGDTMGYDVEIGAPAQLYARALPVGATAGGIVRKKDTGETGALLRFQGGAYAQMNGSKIRPLDRREVIRAMSKGLSAR